MKWVGVKNWVYFREPIFFQHYNTNLPLHESRKKYKSRIFPFLSFFYQENTQDFSFSEISSYYDMSVSVHTYMETLYLGE